MNGFFDALLQMRMRMVGHRSEKRGNRRGKRRATGSIHRRGFRLEMLEDRHLLSAAGLDDLTSLDAAAQSPIPSAAPIAMLDTIGLCYQDASIFFLKNTNEAGVADNTFVYGPGDDEWIPIAGDWNGDSIDTIGLYDPRASVFYLRNSNDAGYANITFSFGEYRAGWLPVAGDWNGDGIDTIGLYDQTTATYYLKNNNTSGDADLTFVYGPAGVGWLPVAGDWNGDGTDTIGLYSPSTSNFYLRDSNTCGFANNTFCYGAAGAGWLPITGDWLNIGIDTIGMYAPTTSVFFLRYSNSMGFANSTFMYGPAACGWLPITGNWLGDGSAFLTAECSVTAATDATTLKQSDLQPAIRAAIDRWAAAGLDASLLARFEQTQFIIADLPGAYLGKALHNTIDLDANAAGHGWFIDPTPAHDEEFCTTCSNDSLQALDPRAVDRIDLLSVIEHELGHIAGFEDLDALSNNVMRGVLGTGIRLTC